ncbi:membrane protein [Bradyrhizobium sp. NFR13]|uniref:YihY/virulence factor BrkB family protein n=1 Tax=Bradyrhizobium sp. NFR13 TaxID=1566285 RepID=UPI0008E6F634|nr:YihY/virulence factor BrkB family protein [Bradyrhizobium sp. NFR13]SFM13366.1 membrane protein [Bradyrhizobium sp. NFR13]
MSAVWRVLKSAVRGYIANESLTRGAAISFYAVTSLTPVLLIVVSVAGIAFGNDVVREGLIGEIGGVLGQESGQLVKSMLAKSSDPKTGTSATVFGIVMLLVTASGVFGEMQSALNATWQAEAPDEPFFSLIRSRATSLGLVGALGFLLMVSLAVSTALSGLADYLGGRNVLAPIILSIINTVVSVGLFTALFAAIYKVLPDTPIAWRDVRTGALLTALMFTTGKSLIGWYLGTTATSSGSGAAGALLVILLWTYYSAQIFLFGSEVTKAIADARSDNTKAATLPKTPRQMRSTR